jgi:hypothetical protein
MEGKMDNGVEDPYMGGAFETDFTEMGSGV